MNFVEFISIIVFAALAVGSIVLLGWLVNKADDWLKQRATSKALARYAKGWNDEADSLDRHNAGDYTDCIERPLVPARVSPREAFPEVDELDHLAGEGHWTSSSRRGE